jgi:hypothetical protein
MARKYQAVLPISVQSGHVLLVRADDRSVQVRFPKSLKAGSVFYFVIPNDDGGGGGGGGDKGGGSASKLGSDDPAAIFDASTEGPSAVVDWVVSIGLGLVVSVSIIFGFIMGILYVTEPLNAQLQAHGAFQPPGPNGQVRIED